MARNEGKMRTIKFRGQQVHDNDWFEGSLISLENGKSYITQDLRTPQERNQKTGYTLAHFSEVIPETVGQFTGLTDKNGTKIFEGDNIRYKTTFLTAIVFYEEGAFQVVFGGMHQHDLKDLDLRYVEVIGNIHERENYERNIIQG